MSAEHLNAYTNTIRRLNKNIKNEYIDIARNLKEVRDFNYLQDTDYKNIADYALKEFGFERSTVYNLISVYEHFFEAEKSKKVGILTYADFSITQLYVMLTMTEEQLKMCKPNMSVNDIKQLKIKKSNRLDNFSVENQSLLKNEIPAQNVITGVFPDKKEEENQKTLIVSELPKSAPKEEIIETKTVITETITSSQNNDFVPNDVSASYNLELVRQRNIELLNQNNLLNEQIKNLKFDNDINSNYRNILRYFYDKLNSISAIQANAEVNILKKEIENYIFGKKLPDKLNFMENVI